METMEVVKAEDVITNYYTGEKWFLIKRGGNYTYVNEARYLEIQNQDSRVKPKIV